MNTRFAHIKNGSALAAVALLTLLPGCGLFDWFKDKTTGADQMATPEMQHNMMRGKKGKVVVSMGDKALITQEQLASKKQEVVAANPQLQAMLGMMDPKQLERNLAEGLTNQKIVEKYIADRGIDKKVAYQQELERTMESVRHMLNMKHFSQEFAVNVSDSDARAFYDKNKDSMPQLVVSRGGVEAKGVEFENEQDAKNFISKVYEVKDLDKAAQIANLSDKVRDFKSVNKQSLGLDAQLRDTITNISKTPSTQMVALKNGKHWVVRATKKENAQYRPFEMVKNDLKQYLEKEQRVQRVDQEVSRLKQEYNVVINEDYFAPAPEMGGNQDAQVAVAANDDAKDMAPQPARAA